jgi:murein DD-endopeptidase MepM/ murein hydrolase activator NlpD
MIPGVTPNPTDALTPISAEYPLSATSPTPYPASPGVFYDYASRSGDTLEALAGRFGVEPNQITSVQPIPRTGFISPGQILSIPNALDSEALSPATLLLPDSELVYSPSALDFDTAAYVAQAGGHLSSYQETLPTGDVLSGAAIVQRVATELSVNPRLLLALLEYRSGWVFGMPANETARIYPIGFQIPGRSGLYQEVMVAATQLNLAYYGWRGGTFMELRFSNGEKLRLDPTLNAGTVALLHLFALLTRRTGWLEALYRPNGFASRYTQMMGDAWGRASAVEPLFPAGLEQPALELPFAPGEPWSLTAGPHEAWNAGTPRGALDFSPVTGEPVCAVSRAWATASAVGVIARSAEHAVALDLDSDGYEATGWVLVYYHLAGDDIVKFGRRVRLDDPLGHPSCEGGRATGKHVHLARKYNGEWLAADGPLPFVLGGWRAYAAERDYHGRLVNGEQVVTSDPGGGFSSSISR